MLENKVKINVTALNLVKFKTRNNTIGTDLNFQIKNLHCINNLEAASKLQIRI